MLQINRRARRARGDGNVDSILFFWFASHPRRRSTSAPSRWRDDQTPQNSACLACFAVDLEQRLPFQNHRGRRVECAAPGSQQRLQVGDAVVVVVLEGLERALDVALDLRTV